jgi:predicted flap endonuclease-1-like 5' DNA nuclease
MLREHRLDGLPVVNDRDSTLLEEPVTWFVTQSLVIIILAFLLGLLVGGLYWGRQWRRVRFDESDAIGSITSRHQGDLRVRQLALGSRDDEITRLTGLLTEAETATGAHQGALAEQDELLARRQAALAQQAAALGGQAAALADRDAALADRDAALLQQDSVLADREALIAGKDAALTDLDALLSERDTVLTERELQIARLSGLLAAADALAGRRQVELATLRAALTDANRQLARSSAPLPTVDRAAGAPAQLNADAGAGSEPAVATAGTAGARTTGTGTAGTATADRPRTRGRRSAALIDIAAAESQDDLRRIEGVGPRIATALNLAGIHTFDGLAETDELTLKTAIGSAGLSFAPSLTSWSRQARLLAAGDEAGFLALIERLASCGDTSVPTQDAAAQPRAPALVDLAPAQPEQASLDDLERVEGIGPRIGSALREAGILTFRLLADAEPARLQAALERAGLRFAPSLPTWSRQARLLAAGDEAGFAALNERITSGHDVAGSA